MRPFNLQEYLKNPERKVVTSDGSPVRIICTDRKTKNDTPIIALVYDEESKLEHCCSFYSTGKYILVEDSKLDLFFAPIKHEGWIHVFRTIGGHYFGGVVYNTDQDAKKGAGEDEGYVTTTKIEWEE